MTVYVDVDSGTGDSATYKATPVKGAVISEILIWATSNGQIQYGIQPGGIQFSDPSVQQGVSTHALYDAIAQEAVVEGVARGYHPVNSTGTATTKVYDANSIVHEFSIKYDTSTSAPIVDETKESPMTTQGTVQ